MKKDDKDNKPPSWGDPSAMDVILDRLREANKDYAMWDKLADASLDRKGYNDFYPKDKKDD